MTSGTGLGGLQAIAKASFGQDEGRLTRIRFKFMAQIRDVDVESAGIVAIVGMPHATKQVLAGNDLPGPGHEMGQYLAGKGTELIEGTVHLKAAGLGVETHATGADEVWRMGK
jgi:hypothetical protein